MTKKTNLIMIGGLICLLFIYFFEPKCLFKMLNIPCISCGLTRGIKYLLKFDIISAIKMNILSIPIFLFIVFSYSLYIISLIKKDDYITVFIKEIINHNKFIIIFFILILINILFTFFF